LKKFCVSLLIFVSKLAIINLLKGDEVKNRDYKEAKACKEENGGE